MSAQRYRRVTRVLRRQQLALQEARLDLAPVAQDLDLRLFDQRTASDVALAWEGRLSMHAAAGGPLATSSYELSGRALGIAMARVASATEQVALAQQKMAKAQERVNVARTRVDRATDRAAALRSEWMTEVERRVMREAEEIHLGRHGGSWR